MGQETDADNLCDVTDNHSVRKKLPVYAILAIGWVLGLILVYAPSPWALGLFFLFGPVGLILALPLISVQMLIARELQHYLSGKIPIRFMHCLLVLLPVPISYYIPAFYFLNFLSYLDFLYEDQLIITLYALLAIIIISVVLSTLFKATRISKLTIAAGLLIFIPHFTIRLLIRPFENQDILAFFIALALFYCFLVFGFSLGLILLGIRSIRYHSLPTTCCESISEQSVPPTI